MERRIQRLYQDLRRRLRRFRLRIPQSLLIFGFIVFATFIMGGGIYDILEKPPGILPGPGGGWIAVHPLMHEQTVNESLLSIIFYLFIFSGFVLSYRSSQIRYDPRRSKMMLTIGLAILVVGVLGCNYLLFLKGKLS